MATSLPRKHIYIIGAQCTGKTTLVNALEQHFAQTLQASNRPAIIREVARTVLKDHGFTAEDIVSSKERSLALQKLILEAQATAEMSALGQAAWFVSDRSGADPIVYALKHVGREAADGLLRSTEWLGLRARMATALVVVCQGGLDWLSDDGVRLLPADEQDWKEFHDMFCDFLADCRLEFVVLPREVADISERVRFVLSKWNSRLV